MMIRWASILVSGIVCKDAADPNSEPRVLSEFHVQ